MTFAQLSYSQQLSIINQQLVVIRQLLRQVLIQNTQILGKEIEMAHTLDEVLAGVSDESSKEDGLITLVQNIKKALDDLLAGGLSPAQQAQVDSLFNQVTNNANKVQAAIDANTTSGGGSTPPASGGNP